MEDLGNHSQDLGNRSPAAPEKHTAWVIWLHGLGDSGTGWTHLMHAVGAQLPHVKWSFPDAAEQSVTCKGGARMRSWFDITELPMTPSQEIGIDGELRISSKALCEPQGLQAAISMVHAMLAQAESMGLSAGSHRPWRIQPRRCSRPARRTLVPQNARWCHLSERMASSPTTSEAEQQRVQSHDAHHATARHSR